MIFLLLKNLPDLAEENLKNQIAAQKNLYHLIWSIYQGMPSFSIDTKHLFQISLISHLF